MSEKHRRRKIYLVGDTVTVKSAYDIETFVPNIGEDYTFPQDCVIDSIYENTGSMNPYHYWVYLTNKNGQKTSARIPSARCSDPEKFILKPYDVVFRQDSGVRIVVGYSKETTNRVIVQRIHDTGVNKAYSNEYRNTVEENNFLSTRKDTTAVYTYADKSKLQTFRNACFAFSFKASEHSDVLQMLRAKNYIVRQHTIRTTQVYTLYLFPFRKKAVLGRSNKKSLIGNTIPKSFVQDFVGTPHITIHTGMACLKALLAAKAKPDTSNVVSSSTSTILPAGIGNTTVDFPDSPTIELSPIKLPTIDM